MSLLEEIDEALVDASGVIGEAAGVERTVAASAVDAVVPAVLGGMADRAESPGGAERLQRLLDDVEAAMPAATNGNGDGDSDDAPTAHQGIGRRLVDDLFGSEQEDLITGLSSGAGLREPLIERALVSVAPVVASVVGRRVTDDDLDADGLAGLVTAERAELVDAGRLRPIADMLDDGAARAAGAITPILLVVPDPEPSADVDAEADVDVDVEADVDVEDAAESAAVDAEIEAGAADEVDADDEVAATVDEADGTDDVPSSLLAPLSAEEPSGERQGRLGRVWWVLGAAAAVLVFAALLATCSGGEGADDGGPTTTDDSVTTSTDEDDAPDTSEPDVTSTTPTTSPSSVTTGTSAPTTTEPDPEAELAAAVDSILDGRSGVTASIDGGTVALDGVVPDEDEAADLAERVAALPGVELVVNRLAVEPPSEDDGGTGDAGDTLNERLDLDPVTFAYLSTVITPEGEQVLDRAARYLIDNPTIRVEIGGHTDSDGPADDNQRLSELRAAEVRSFLIARGVDADRLEARGYGETEPTVPNDTPENKAVNRRIEFTIL